MAFTIWTRFEIPDSVLFKVGVPYSIVPEFDQQLKDSVRYLIQAPGHRESNWGRVSEQPEKIILVSLWKCEDSFTAFKATPEYLQYWIGLSDISSITPIERETNSTWGWPMRLMGRTGFFSISVPSPVSDITRAELRGLKDLQKAGGSKFSRCAYCFPLDKVWLLGIEEVEGTEVETMLYICWWRDEEAEKDFKNCVTPPGETRTRLDKFLANARSAGAVYIIEEHCDFIRIHIYD